MSIKFISADNAQLTISAVFDAAEEIACCSRTPTEINQPHAANIDGPVASSSSPSPPSPPPPTDVGTNSNGHKSISTTENNTHNADASDNISRVSSSNSVHNQNRKSSINLEPGFIETIMDDYVRKID